MILTYVLLWMPMVLIAIINALIRQYGYLRLVGELTAHQISTVTGIVLFGVYIWFVTGRWRIESAGQAVAIGLLWLVMTVAFEFLFGHYIAGHPWERLLLDYNLIAGRVWVFVLLWIAVAPYIMFRLRS
jgi:hypothetical protein